MTIADVRSRYLAFFEKRGHKVIPSAPIVPGNDPTTLFTSSGMQPLVPYLLGQPHPEGNRLANSQLSFRAGDIDEVGDNRHTTFFEMLGNWSLGDYFKKEQLAWIFEFLTNVEEGLGLDPAKLYVTVYSGDEALGIPEDQESIGIWKELFKQKGLEASERMLGTEEEGYKKGIQSARIFGYRDKNWWSRSGSPAYMPAGEPGGPDSEVFYDFETAHDSRFGEHCHPNCDCGRFVEIANSVFMEYIKEADGGFKGLPQKNVDFGGGLERLTAVTLGNPDIFQINIFDSARKVLEEFFGKKHGEDEETTRAFRIIMDHTRAALFILAEGVAPSNTEAGYVLRRLLRRSMLYCKKLDPEGQSFLALGALCEWYAREYEDTYPQLLEKIGEINEKVMAEENKFTRAMGQGLREFEKLAKKGSLTGHDAFVLFSSYGFPIEITEELAGERGISIDLAAFTKEMEEHQAKSRTAAEGRFKGGLADHSDVTVRYHTSHHLLLAALRELLGDSVHQRGSNITQERVRLDFSFDRKLTPEELQAAENLVNQKIQEALPVFATPMPKEKAVKLGAEQEFGVKYGDTVTVYSMGPKDATKEDPKFDKSFSLEFCGGPHVSNTSELADGGKSFKIIKEEAVAAGVRRIKAVLV